MADKKVGKQTLQFASAPALVSWASVVGPMEGQGQLGEYFDMVLEDNLVEGEKTWEKSEQKLMQHSIELALEKVKKLPGDLDFYFAGDLMNQIITANFTARFLNIPFLGLYGACSTLAEGLLVASVFLDGGFAEMVGVSASSHHDTAERVYRFPTEQGTQRPPSAQWTVTGAGSYVLQKSGTGIVITHATIGKISDLGEADANDMGAAMAPAACDTIITHLQDTGRKAAEYDLIVTGDLGTVGLALLKELLTAKGCKTERVTDCGIMVYTPEQDAHAGGSGCGCSAVVLNYFLKEMQRGKYHRLFFVGTGALLSPTSSLQGESIPGIAHGVVLETR